MKSGLCVIVYSLLVLYHQVYNLIMHNPFKFNQGWQGYLKNKNSFLIFKFNWRRRKQGCKKVIKIDPEYCFPKNDWHTFHSSSLGTENTKVCNMYNNLVVYSNQNRKAYIYLNGNIFFCLEETEMYFNLNEILF